MGGGWRSEATVAVGCVALLPWWVWVTGLNTDPFWLVVFAAIIGVGVGYGLSGVRRGGPFSRVASGLCLAILAVVGVGFTALMALVP